MLLEALPSTSSSSISAIFPTNGRIVQQAFTNPTLNASIAGMDTNITTPNSGSIFVQAGLYGTAKFADNAYAYAGLSGEARSGQTLGAVNVGVRVQF